MTANEKMLKHLITRGGILENITMEEKAKILLILDKASDEIVGKIASTDGTGTRAWLADMKTSIDAIYARVSVDIESLLKADLEPLAVDEINELMGAYQETVTASVSFTAPAPAQVWATITALPAAGSSTLAQLTEALGVGSSKAVTEAIQQGIIQGETIQQLTKRIRGNVITRAYWKKDEDGVRRYHPGVYDSETYNITTRGAETLARTAVMHVGNQAREEFYAQNEDLISGYQRIETLDGETCLECGAMDGAEYAIDDPRPDLPEHPNCRGLYLPILKSWKELGLDGADLSPGSRASMDGQVPENTTYADMLRSKSEAEQNRLIGPTRAAMFRAGVPLTDMVSDGKTIPLADLKASA